MANSIRVVAHISAKPDKIEETRQALLDLVDPTRTEDGCITYELMQNTSDPTDFTFVEEWTSESALQRHLSTDHIAKCRSEIAECITADPDIRIYSVLR